MKNTILISVTLIFLGISQGTVVYAQIPWSIFSRDTSRVQLSDSAIIYQDSIRDVAGKLKTEFLSFNMEFGGNGVMLSYFIDFRFLKNYSLKVGWGGYAENGRSDTHVLVTMAQYIFFPGEAHIEVGLGTVTELREDYWNSPILESSQSRVKGTAFIGLRIQSYFEGVLFRIGYTPFFNLNSYMHYGGLSIGCSF